ncbi:hypothetical protein PF010_g16324 [Phytophthora fragariae]|uniref:Uncharacterized protein n=1 Tax=Phytophthora fragariae TaxID=53985 RepID=A0A6G0KRX0_9STRA|nr:hypothetical protein PF010_g16324 [Phytophthora fragariae]
MALALRFAEEGEFSSRACDVSLSAAPDAAPSKAIFRWSRAARQLLQGQDQVHVKTLVVAMLGPAQQLLRQLTRDWVSVGTLVTTDQLIHPCNLQPTPSTGVILAKKGLKEQDNTLVVLVGQDVPVAASWAWLKTLKQHVEAEEVVCLDSQLSTVYADQFSDGDKLRMLASAAVTDEMKKVTPVRPLEVPQFVTGIPAALLTDGELRKRRVRVYVSLRDVSTTSVDVMRSFLPLVASSSSVLGELQRPLFFQPTGESTHDAGSLNVLYTGITHLFSSSLIVYFWFCCRCARALCCVHCVEQPRSASARQFSTRFLPSDGIPEYNALLDSKLGKRREFLLGNRHSLQLMQQTGVIERVETQPDNPNQYVVHIAEKSIHRRKRLPPRSGSGSLQLPESQTMPWRQSSSSRSILEGFAGHSTNSLRRGSSSASRLDTVDDFTENGDSDLSAAKKTNAATLKGLSRSYSTNTVLTTSNPVLKSSAANRLALFGSTKCSALLESSGAPVSVNPSKHRAASEVASSHVTEVRQRSRSAVPAALGPTLDEFKKKGVQFKRSIASTAAASAPQTAVKGTVEYLLESDATFMTQIRMMKEHLTALENTKAYLDTEIGCLRRKLRGVNAVRENDVAVAHCSSIMQHRLSKAEEEFMKLVTQQQEVRKDVDRVRRELLSLRKVRHKLQEDIEDVAQANQSYEEKIHASKSVRNQLSEELSELERRAEVELEAQRLNLPPEDAVVVDVAKLMGAVQERNLVRRCATVGLAQSGSSSRSLLALQASAAITPADKSPKHHSERRGSVTGHPKTLLDYCSAFRVLQNSMGFEDVASFEQQFTAAEEQLLSKYKANLALADEVAALEKELAAVNTEKKVNRANARRIIQANEKMERDIQTRIQTTLSSVKSYNELRELRNREHAKLRGIMLRCLDALQIDIGGSDLPESDGAGSSGATSANSTGAGSSTHSLYWTETQSPELLEMLQRKMTQVAVTLKVKHHSRVLEIPPEALLRMNRGHDGRRSNMFSTREASKIVMGPREPSGSALAAILGTVQPPSVENALVLTENANMMEVMHGLHRAISPARRKASSLSLAPPEMGRVDGPRASGGSINGASSAAVALLHAGGVQARRSKTDLFSIQRLGTRPSLAVMVETDKEGEEEEEEEEEEDDDGEDGSEDDDDDDND